MRVRFQRRELRLPQHGDGCRHLVDANTHNASGSIVVVNGFVQGMGSWGVAVSRTLGNVIRNVAATSNGAGGIYAFSSLLDGVSAVNNGGRGIDINYGTLRHSQSTVNGGDGVFAFHALLLGNFVQGNGGYGLNGQDATGAGQNMIQTNGRGDVAPGLSLVAVDRNVCDRSPCP